MNVYVIFGFGRDWHREGSTLLFIYEDKKKAKRRLAYLRKRLKSYLKLGGESNAYAYDSYELEEYEVIK